MLETTVHYIKENHLALLATLAALVLGLYQVKKARKEKSLSYDVVQKTKLFTINDENMGDLAFLFNGQRVKDPHVFEVAIFCRGSASITTSDYEQPIRIVFSENTHILSAALIEKHPDNLIVDFQVDQNVLQIKPLLLNVDDWLKFKILLESSSPNLRVDARIKGVKSITKSKFLSSRVKYNFLIYYLCLGMLAVSIASTIMWASTKNDFLTIITFSSQITAFFLPFFMRFSDGDLVVVRILKKLSRRES
jgi:hypothetical protein